MYKALCVCMCAHVCELFASQQLLYKWDVAR
jgi:hypothetical protein